MTSILLVEIKKKNAVAISSHQSKIIESHEKVIHNYEKSIKKDNLSKCPNHWGGFSFTPYYFEFWHGHESRVNKREVFELRNNQWIDFFIQP